MTLPRTDIRQYDVAMQEFVRVVMESFLANDPLFGQIASSHSIHHGPIRNVRSPATLDQETLKLKIDASIAFDSIRRSRIDDFVLFLHEIATKHRSEFAKGFFRNLSQITTTTGNTLNAGGKPFSWDQYNDLLEKVEIEFNDDGTPQLPTLVMPPDLFEYVRQLPKTADQLERERQILQRKWDQFNAKKRSRRLFEPHT